MPGPVFGHLAGAAGDDVLVAFAAGLAVVGRAETVADGLGFFEDEAVVVERSQGHDGVFVDGGERRALRVHAVGLVVETRRRFGRRPDGRRRQGFGGYDAVVGEALATLLVGAGFNLAILRRSCDDDQRAADGAAAAIRTDVDAMPPAAHLQPCARKVSWRDLLEPRTGSAAVRLSQGRAGQYPGTPGGVIEAGQENRSQAPGGTSRYSSRIRRLRSLLRNSGEIPRYPAT